MADLSFLSRIEFLNKAVNMDELIDIFDLCKNSKRKTYPRGILSGNTGRLLASEDHSSQMTREYVGTEYAKEVVKNEKMNQLKLDAANVDANEMNNIESLSDDSSICSENVAKCKTNDDGIRSKFDFAANFDENLPIFSSKETIIETIRKNSAIIIEGDTGCGKTTQVPQYILANAFENEEYCKIVVTQPRRIAAISISKRVSEERNWPEGSLVGFQVGLHANYSAETRLLYCTTGVLLQKIIFEKSLGSFTHIILDEVHERDQDMDFLLIVIRRFLNTTGRHVKVILMSATFNTNEFSQYFTIHDKPAPVIKVDQRRQYNVSEYFLDDLQRINMNDTSVSFLKPEISQDMYILCVKLIMVINNIEEYEKEQQSLAANSARQRSSILVFLPGLYEIDCMHKKLMECCESPNNISKMHLIRLHSLIPPDEQIKVFRNAPNGYLKVILATNIAESSITVPDVKYVIDFCLTKVCSTDSATNFSVLQLQWAARANCRQRAGRAGRVSNGRVYRLIPKSIYKYDLEEFAEPEMLRSPLETLILKSKMLDMGTPISILGLAMNPPNLSDIENTILKLKEIGGMYLESNKEAYVPIDGNITFIGKVMAALPIDVRLTRLILLGYIFSVLDDAVVIAAGLSVRSIFKSYASNQNISIAAHVQKLRWADNSGSDMFAILRVYNTWVQMRARHLTNDKSEQCWADHFFINLRAMKEMYLLVQDIHARLSNFGVKNCLPHERINWSSRERTIILKIIIAGAFYPNYFIRSNSNDVEIERNIYQILSGNDPCNTVYLTNFNIRNVGPLYSQYIKDCFKCIGVDPQNIELRFPSGAERVYVIFKDADGNKSTANIYDGCVRHEVTKSLYLRLIGVKITIPIMDTRLALRYLQDNEIGSFKEGIWVPPKQIHNNYQDILLPSPFENTIRGYITHIESCSKFYFQPISEVDNLRRIRSFLTELNKPKYAFANPSDVSRDMVVAAPFGNMYHRAKIVKVLASARQQIMFKVQFIDYGNEDNVDFKDLRMIPKSMKLITELPGRCFQCRLALVKPSSYISIKGLWSDGAMELLQKKADEGLIKIEVYSVVSSVANVLLNDEGRTFNEMLVELCLARATDENFMSKVDHDFRMRKQKGTMSRFRDADYDLQIDEYKQNCLQSKEIIIPPPPQEKCTKTLNLKGPFSPLESQISYAIRDGLWKSVTIDRESVNCVLLDTDPQDKHQRLVVAASISEGQNSDVLLARNTTIMPNIHGFGALMAMIFCPKLEIKTNKASTKYSAILAGLGYNPKTKQPLYAEHDIVMNLDVEIERSDINLVNQIRFCMNSMLYTEIGEMALATNSRNRAELCKTLKSSLTQLLNKSRKFIEVVEDINYRCWNSENFQRLEETPDLFGQRGLFPPHSLCDLVKEKMERICTLNENCRELHHIRQLDCNIKPILCKLCNVHLNNVIAVRMHLLSQLHRDRESQINFSLTTR